MNTVSMAEKLEKVITEGEERPIITNLTIIFTAIFVF